VPRDSVIRSILEMPPRTLNAIVSTESIWPAGVAAPRTPTNCLACSGTHFESLKREGVRHVSASEFNYLEAILDLTDLNQTTLVRLKFKSPVH